MKFRRALVSVSDKSGLLEFLKPLVERGLEVVSTGGTAKYLMENSIPVIEISKVTGFPEVMDGRVKTLHPNIHMSLLARQDNLNDNETLKKFELKCFDLVVGNLYPFEKALNSGKKGSELIEYIDIGGPSFLRAAAKNYERITVVCDPKDYFKINEDLSEAERKKLAAKVFSHTSSYDSLIAKTLIGEDVDSDQFSISGKLVKTLRYGENPHQSARWYSNLSCEDGLHEAEIIQGKDLSYNNLLDLDATLSCIQDFTDPACVAVKHLNPCGVAESETLFSAVQIALKSDPVSVFGGIIGVNKILEKPEAEELSKLFLECIVAPDFTEEALQIFKKKKNLRILRWPHMLKTKVVNQIKSINGGFLVQSVDETDKLWQENWKNIGLAPCEQMKKNILMGLKVCSRLKSNAIAIVGERQTLGLGMGQVNRVDAVHHAIERWKKFHPDKKEVVLVSDAFFPFSDSIELCAQAGISWIVQPGGSLRDNEVIETAKKKAVNMILTGQRHFYH